MGMVWGSWAWVKRFRMAATERVREVLARNGKLNVSKKEAAARSKREPSMMNRRRNAGLLKLERGGVRSMVLGSVMALCTGIGLAQFGGANAQPNSSTPPGQEPGQTNPITTNPGATEPKTGMPETGVNLSVHGMADKMFLRKAAEDGLAEVQLAQLAAASATSPAVKDFSNVMVEGHQQLNDALLPIDKSMGVQTPTKLDKKSQAELKRLRALSGTEFDKEYLAFMIKSHRADEKAFEQEGISTENKDLQTIVLKAQKMIEAHLKLAESLANNPGATTASK